LTPIEREALISKFKVGVFFQQDVDLGNDEINFGTESEASSSLLLHRAYRRII